LTDERLSEEKKKKCQSKRTHRKEYGACKKAAKVDRTDQGKTVVRYARQVGRRSREKREGWDQR